MRVLRRYMAGLLGVAATALVSLPFGTTAAVADDTSTLTVSPTHGTAGTQMTLTYRTITLLGCGDNKPTMVTFLMDASVIGSAPLVQDGEACVAELYKPPPKGRAGAPGRHTIRDTRQSGNGYVEALSTPYTIDAAPTSPDQPTQTRVPTRSPTPRAKTSTGATGPTATQSGTGDAPLSAVPGGTASPTSVVALGDPSGSSALPVILIVAGLLTLVGVAVVGYFVYRSREGDAGPAAPAADAPGAVD